MENPAIISANLIANVPQLPENLSVSNNTVIGQNNEYKVWAERPRLPLYKNYEVPKKNLAFIGRKSHLFEIREHISRQQQKLQESQDPERKSQPKPTIYTLIHGTGGAGKSQLALELIWSEQNPTWAHVLWLSSGSRDILINNYINLGLRHRVLDLERDKPVPNEVKVKIVLDWLTSMEESTLLIIYDRVDKYETIQDLIPATSSIVIFTSRFTEEWPVGCLKIDVKPFSPGESLEYIQQIVPPGKYDTESAFKLSSTLGHLPLALACACAYVKRTREMTLQGYLKFYAERQSRLSLLMKDKLLPEYSESVFVTWDISMDALCEKAKEWVNICALFYNENIPSFLLECFLQGNPESSTILTAPSNFEASLEFLEIQSELESYSLMSINSGFTSVQGLSQARISTMTIHNLIQVVCRLKWDMTKSLEYLQKARNTVEAEYGRYSDTELGTERQRIIAIHLQTLVDFLQNSEKEFGVSVPSVEAWIIYPTFFLADAYLKLGNPEGSIKTMENLSNLPHVKLEGLEKVAWFGLIGNCYSHFGCHPRGHKFLKKAEDEILKLPPATTWIGNDKIGLLEIKLKLNLGDVHRVKEEWAEAEKYYVQLLELNNWKICSRNLGSRDSFIPRSLIFLGLVYLKTGEYVKSLNFTHIGILLLKKLGYDSNYEFVRYAKTILVDLYAHLGGGITDLNAELESIYKFNMKNKESLLCGIIRMHQGLQSCEELDFQIAIKHFQQSLNLLKVANFMSEMQSLELAYQAQCNLGFAYIASGDYQHGVQFMEEAVKLLKNVKKQNFLNKIVDVNELVLEASQDDAASKPSSNIQSIK